MTKVREKLNVAFVNGAVLFAVVAGASTGSLLIGVIALVASLALAIYGGDIRLTPIGRKQ